MKNRHKVLGALTEVYITQRNGSVWTVLIDTVDIPMFRHKTISVAVKPNYVYALISNKGKLILLHRCILGMQDSPLQVDHIDNNPLNCSRLNIRPATNAENAQNRAGSIENSTTGVRGVTICGYTGKYVAQVRLNGKSKHLGLFTDLAQAEQCVKKYRAEHMPFSKEAIELCQTGA